MANALAAPVVDAPTPNFSTDEDLPSDTTTIVGSIADKHTHTVIFLHGREDFGSYLAKDFFDSKSSDGRTLPEIFPSVRWVFPTAKLRYSAKRDYEFSISSFAKALKGEEILSQWFDVWDIRTPDEKTDLMLPGLQESIAKIIDIIREEAQMVPLERIILGGISQGCATAMLTLLSSGIHLGGYIGWCGWLPFQKTIKNFPISCIHKEETSQYFQSILKMSIDKNVPPFEQAIQASEEVDAEPGAEITSTTEDIEAGKLEATLGILSIHTQCTTETPVFLAHSLDDETVPFTLGEGLHQTIKRLGFDVTWKKYEDGGHWIHPEHGVDDMSTFLRKVFKI